MQAIEIRKLKKSFHKDREQIVVIDNLSINFSNGKFYAIVGESGAGKSTLLKCLSLLYSIDSGTIIINNNNVSKLTDDDLCSIRLNEIGIIFQEYNLFKFLNALENVLIPLLLNNGKKDDDNIRKAKEILNYVGLNKRINHFPNELSGGEQQRVAIARALINNPHIILADEPTGNLDEKNKKIILELLKKISEDGKCVIVVTHDADVLNYADEVFSLVNGKLIKYGQ